MEAFGILGFVFGLIGFITANKNTKRIEELQKELMTLKNKIEKEN